MALKKVKVDMPTTMAGIIGLSPDEKLSDFEIDAHAFLIGVALLIIIAKLFHIFVI